MNNYPNNNYNHVQNNQGMNPPPNQWSQRRPDGYPNRKSGNTGLIVAVSILGVLVLAAAIFCALWISGVIQPANDALPASAPADSAVAPVEEQPAPTPTVMYVANVKHSIYFRSQPAENSSNIICEIPLGTAVTFIDNADAIFAKITYNNQEGYVKREYLSSSVPQVSTPAPAPAPAPYSTRYMTVCNVKVSIYLRSQPVENSSNIICEIPVNSVVEFLENANGTFYKIRWNGYVGYSKAEYLR